MKKILSLAVTTALITSITGCQTQNVTVKKTAVINNLSNKSATQAKKWGYGEVGSIAPEHWGDLEVNKLCKAGTEQSPINVEKVFKPKAGDKMQLVHTSLAQDFSVNNNGHTIVFNAKDTAVSKVSVNGKEFNLLQFHYHIPSEHTVMNTHYPLEIHFVHQSSDGLLAVVGVLYKQGNSNSALQKVITNLPQKGNDNVSVVNFDITSLIPKQSATYAYKGSLTTPPCSEQVQWLLKETPVEVSPSQLSKLAGMYNNNNRPVQPVGNRKVSYEHKH